MAARKRINIFIVSDGTGVTAESVLTSVSLQFQGSQINIKRFPFTRTKEQLKEILNQAPQGKCIIVFTLVSKILRKIIVEEGKKKNLSVVDVMGPLINKFSTILEHSPAMRPGVFAHQDDEMYLLTEAIHYTLLHDDGLGYETLHQADLIILGVSRTGKTPASIYLSCKKLKVANIPIINQVPLPPVVLKAPAKKVGFRMSLERLIQLRSQRMKRMAHAQLSTYTSASHLIEELDFCEKVYKKVPSLRTIDVTNRSIEETSEWITHNVL